ncbi:hypothetical protein [Parafilimonas terrae]|uniref:Uncharacterized protein n=1 Tax=Parafilimonas terrae TaxID=1465490 RepID=A0A1I5VL35_9BACT|nr:hypothetical protein [Parafilimonas terrae]SFQ07706.1 hypothetical protein SAMN05444277_10529 [Parafilimonas terrae]
MAKQKGPAPIQGTIGNLTFFKSQDGFMVKTKSEVSKSKILSDPGFQRTRENMAEFGSAGKAGKILRTASNSVLQQSADNRMVSRLAAQMLKVIKSDTVGKRGERSVTSGNIALLSGFDFNNKGILSTTLISPYDVVYTRASGDLTFSLPSFIPAQGIVAPQGATHYKLQLAAAPVDFGIANNMAQLTASSVLPWDNVAATALTLALSLPAASALPVFVLLQVQFFIRVNADDYPLNNGAYNACAIISISTP